MFRKFLQYFDITINFFGCFSVGLLFVGWPFAAIVFGILDIFCPAIHHSLVGDILFIASLLIGGIIGSYIFDGIIKLFCLFFFDLLPREFETDRFFSMVYAFCIHAPNMIRQCFTFICHSFRRGYHYININFLSILSFILGAVTIGFIYSILLLDLLFTPIYFIESALGISHHLSEILLVFLSLFIGGAAGVGFRKKYAAKKQSE